MLAGWSIVLTAFAYLSLLFAIAYYVDKRADAGRSVISSPYIYALSLAVYCTSWTYYGSVGRAASSGIDFLPTYLGPTLTFVLWWYVLRKIVSVSKAQRITSIADFISSRYGKSASLSVMVTVIAVIGITPYISLQLKAVSASFYVLLQYPEVTMPPPISQRVTLFGDIAFLVTLFLSVFAILFGTRHIDASEHHEGMVAAVAFESVVKLLAFLAVGIFVTFSLYDGFGPLFAAALQEPQVVRIFTTQNGADYSQWMTLTLLSMVAIFCLPRQFQVTVVENVDEGHLSKAAWLFPLYLFLMNIFVLPIAVGGLLRFPSGSVDADTFVLTLPMADQQEFLALFAFIGGLSAATGMVIVCVIALSTMICNDLVMPILLRVKSLRLTERGDLTGLLLFIRRASIVLLLLLGYAYFRFIGVGDTLVTIGLVSFAAAAQFAPAIIGGILWKGGTCRGAQVGLALGFVIWVYTLLLPFLARPGWLPVEFIENGPFGITLLKPYALFGLEGFGHLTHALFWSMLGNIGGYIATSLWSRQSPLERIQAVLFVDQDRHASAEGASPFWRGSATVPDLHALVVRFVGPDRANRAFTDYARKNNVNLAQLREADAGLVSFTERVLAGAIGAASARVMVGTVAKGEVVGIDEVLEILQETSQVIEYSHRLEEKSRELEATTAELRQANRRLQEFDRMKDDFLSTVSHELRTPLTSIRSFSEILADNPDLSEEERQRFLEVLVKESERLTRLINQILDLAKLETGALDWDMTDFAVRPAIEDALAATSAPFREEGLRLDVRFDEGPTLVRADRDKLIQVVVNLVSNAAKFCRRPGGLVVVEVTARGDWTIVSVSDNGPGVAPENRSLIFEKFQQVGEGLRDRPKGTGLGLAISRQFVERFGGDIWVETSEFEGARFVFTLPILQADTYRQSAE